MRCLTPFSTNPSLSRTLLWCLYNQGMLQSGPSAADAEAARDVRAAIADLPDATDRLIIHECFFAGRSLRDLADALNIDRETLRRRFHALLDGLRDKLRGHI